MERSEKAGVAAHPATGIPHDRAELLVKLDERLRKRAESAASMGAKKAEREMVDAAMRAFDDAGISGKVQGSVRRHVSAAIENIARDAAALTHGEFIKAMVDQIAPETGES